MYYNLTIHVTSDALGFVAFDHNYSCIWARDADSAAFLPDILANEIKQQFSFDIVCTCTRFENASE